MTWKVSRDVLHHICHGSPWGFRRLYPWSELYQWSETNDAFFLSLTVWLPASIAWVNHPRLGLADLRDMPVVLPKRFLTPAQTERVRSLIRPPEP